MPEKIIDVPGFGPTAFPDSMSDDDIVKAIQSQHPDLAPKATATPAVPATATDMLRGIGRMVTSNPMVSGPVDGIIGAGKELGHTAVNLLNRIRENSRFVPPIMPKIDENSPAFTPSNASQKLGAGLATVGEYALPSAEAAKIPAVAALGIPARAAVEAGISGGVSKARGEDTPTAFKSALLTGGMTAGFGVLSKTGSALGERIEQSLLKPVKADLADVKGPPEQAAQTMVKNLFKHDLGGTLPESYTKAAAKTKELGNQLRMVLASNPAADVDLFQTLVDTSHELSANSAANFGTNAAIKKAVNNLLEEISTVSPTGRVNLADAQDIKQALGAIGSWQNGARDADSTAMETVANAMYTKMKTAIEQASGQSQAVKDINAQFGEIIPIKNALIRRIPIVARRDPISLKEALGIAAGGIHGTALTLADRVLRSGTAANMLVQAGKVPAATGAAITPKVTGAAVSAADRLRQMMGP